MEVTIEPTNTLQDLVALYNQTKTADTADSSKLTSNFTLKGMDEVKSMVSAAMMQIEEFTSKGKEQSLVSATTSKALALVDSKNKWIGKWFNGKVDAAKIESIQQQTVSEIIATLKDNVNTKRDEVISLIEDLSQIRLSMLDRLEVYYTIDQEATKLVHESIPSTRAKFDSQQLATMVKATIEKMTSDIQSLIEPLIASATISVQQIQSLMPTIENDLQSKLSIKAFQQQLQDLNEMVKATTDLATNAGNKIRTSVNETIYQSLELLGETGIDMKALKQQADDEIKHQEKIAILMKKTSDKINSNFNEMSKIQSTMIANKTKVNSTLIAQYSGGITGVKELAPKR